MENIKDFYEYGECPDCGEPIPDDAVEGSECVNCGHVFYAYSPDEPSDGFLSDAEADADVLASAGWGMDEDYNHYEDAGFEDF